MLTKKEAALAVVGEFCLNKRMGPEDLTDEHVYLSSKLAVAMEYLNLIKSDEAKKHAATRGGTLDKVVLYYFSDSGVKTLSFREIFDLLPEDNKKSKIEWKNVKPDKETGVIRWRDIK